jgi:hypothetical protein
MYSEIPDWMDGRGLTRATGTHGIMGRKGDYSFVWLGGTTPFHSDTWAAMATVGPRLLFIRLRKEKPGDPVVSASEYGSIKAACGTAVRAYLEWLFTKYDKRSQAWPKLSRQLEDQIQHHAELMAMGQTYLLPRAGPADDPVRPTANHLYQRLAIITAGLAFIRGRDPITEDEVQLGRRITASNAPKVRGPVLRALDEGHLTIPAIAAATGLRYPQVQGTLEELRRLQVVEQVTLGIRGGAASRWRLAPKPIDPWAGVD